MSTRVGMGVAKRAVGTRRISCHVRIGFLGVGVRSDCSFLGDLTAMAKTSAQHREL